MKKFSRIFVLCGTVLLLLSLCGVNGQQNKTTQITATTLPVYQFTVLLTANTGLTVSRLIDEPVSCLHDYSLSVNQVQAAEAADLIILSGAGLEEFMEDILVGKSVIDSSAGIPLLEEHCHDEDREGHTHHHESDPHIWLNPENAKMMAKNICSGLSGYYPQFSSVFNKNLDSLSLQLDNLHAYGNEQLRLLSCRDLITFHDGFSYFADAYHLTILEAIEEESGSEASAQELVRLIRLTQNNGLPAIFIEKNGSPSAASIISAETDVQVAVLDMAMADSDYFEAMYHNIDAVKEALG